MKPPHIIATLIFTLTTTMIAAQAPPDEAVERMVREGMLVALEAHFKPPRTADQLRLLGHTAMRRAARSDDSQTRQEATATGRRYFRAWINALKGDPTAATLGGRVRLAAAHADFAGALLAHPVAVEIDEHDLTGGRRGDRERLVALLQLALSEYDTAASELDALSNELTAYEEDLLAAGVFDLYEQTRLDVQLNRAWTRYFLGVFLADENSRREHLAQAESDFHHVANQRIPQHTRHTCHLALAMIYRERERFDDALRAFRRLLAETTTWALEARSRCELARTQLERTQFEEARRTLRPLIDADAQAVEAARFHVNLAHIWHAYSYLQEARHLRKAHPARPSAHRQARQLRATGLARLAELARQGGAWPGLVQLYLQSVLDTNRPLGELSAFELLYSARALLDDNQPAAALPRLQAARQRDDVQAELAADILHELGRCQYQLGDERAAAETFAELASTQRNSKHGPQAATFAYQLWARVAEASNEPADYLALAGALQNLVEHYADHPQRDEALWLWPVALQMAGEHEQAARRYALLPANSAHAPEAAYRELVCRKSALLEQHGAMDTREYARDARELADKFIAYSRRAAAGAATDAARERWSAEARLRAASLLVGPGVEDFAGALNVLADFEDEYADHELLGRVLAVRIRAYRGLRQFEQASHMLSRYLAKADPETVGPTLAALARGMQAEVERLVEAGETDRARHLASDAATTFAELEQWVRADDTRTAILDSVLAGRARMCLLAEDYVAAAELVKELLERHPRNGNYLLLRARVHTQRLGSSAGEGQLKEAQDAWAALLAHPELRQDAPQHYWEARYHWLVLAKRLGRSAEVVRAIEQERVWHPELGGPRWKERFLALLEQARAGAARDD